MTIPSEIKPVRRPAGGGNARMLRMQVKRGRFFTCMAAKVYWSCVVQVPSDFRLTLQTE
ncbi:hypothetical protein GCM10008012_56250 [Rhizobium anhuiense]|nr:hypothetical protein GCM10008012_56250 [Rhizobium anhuiense]